MKKNWSKSLFGLCFACLLSITLAGCSNKYNASVTGKFYNELYDWCDSDFLETNKIYGASYVYEDENGDFNTYYFEDEGAPRFRNFVVKTEEEYEQIFIGEPISVNFNSQMLIICTCAVFNNREIKIRSIRRDDEILLIKFRTENPAKKVSDTIEPTQKYLFVVMDRLDVNDVSFELQY